MATITAMSGHDEDRKENVEDTLKLRNMNTEVYREVGVPLHEVMDVTPRQPYIQSFG